MIKELTPDQEAQLDVVRRRWIKRAIVEEWSPKAAKVAVKKMYAEAKRHNPMVLCSDNPVPALLAIKSLILLEKIDGKITQRHVDAVQRLANKVELPPDASSLREMATTLQTEFWSKLCRNLKVKTKEKLESALWTSPTDGAGLCYWRAFYDFFIQEFDMATELKPHIALDMAGAFWWWLFEDVAVLCGPPKYKFDRGDLDGEPYRLHREDGPAVQWPDGFALYFWRGISVPREWPMGFRDLDFGPIFLKEENQERRRVIAETVGWDKLLYAIKAKRVQRDDYGALLEADLGDDNGKPAKFVDLKCPSTGRRYVIRTDPAVTSCREGLAKMAGVLPEEYLFSEET